MTVTFGWKAAPELGHGESVDVTGARVAGGTRIGIGDPAVTDYRDARAAD